MENELRLKTYASVRLQLNCALVQDLLRLSFTTSSDYWSECAERDLNPHERYRSHELKPCASANFAIRAFMEAGGFEPPNPKERIYSPPQLTALLCFLILTTRDTLFRVVLRAFSIRDTRIVAYIVRELNPCYRYKCPVL